MFSSSSLNLLSDLGRRINDKSEDATQIAYLSQRIFVAIQRFNSMLLHDTLIVDSPDLAIQLLVLIAHTGCTAAGMGRRAFSRVCLRSKRKMA